MRRMYLWMPYSVHISNVSVSPRDGIALHVSKGRGHAVSGQTGDMWTHQKDMLVLADHVDTLTKHATDFRHCRPCVAPPPRRCIYLGYLIRSS